ncbi:MAG: hypothetical protein K2H80_02065, partial [Ureaplasma sp.]|nr:hypothetical protein [Ureaplasma sp.]
KSQNKLKLTTFQILLIVLTFGIYFLVLKFKFKNENQISEYNSSLQSKQIELEINKIQNEINSLMHDKKYENVDIELLRNKKRDLDTATANHSSYLAKKAIFKKYNIELNDLQKELSTLSNELESKRQIKTKISKELDQMLSNEFSNFEIELFDSKGNEKIQIKQNNIDLKFLNHANKWNIIFEINDFLKSKTLISFTVIDGTESFNKISRNENVQVICSKVTTDEKLILNGQHIN